jgi:hypothetical protein
MNTKKANYFTTYDEYINSIKTKDNDKKKNKYYQLGLLSAQQAVLNVIGDNSITTDKRRNQLEFID